MMGKRNAKRRGNRRCCWTPVIRLDLVQVQGAAASTQKVGGWNLVRRRASLTAEAAGSYATPSNAASPSLAASQGRSGGPSGPPSPYLTPRGHHLDSTAAAASLLDDEGQGADMDAPDGKVKSLVASLELSHVGPPPTGALPCVILPEEGPNASPSSDGPSQSPLDDGRTVPGPAVGSTPLAARSPAPDPPGGAATDDDEAHRRTPSLFRFRVPMFSRIHKNSAAKHALLPTEEYYQWRAKRIDTMLAIVLLLLYLLTAFLLFFIPWMLYGRS